MGENWIFGSKFKDFFKRWRFNRTLHYFRIILEASKGYVKNSPAWKDRLGGSSGSFLLVGKLEAFHEGLLLGPLEGQEFIKLDSFQNEPTWIPQKS